MAEDQDEDEDVVEAEALLDEIAGDEGEPRLRALEIEQAGGEEGGQRDIDGAELERLGESDLMGTGG